MVEYENIEQGTGRVFTQPDPAKWVGTNGVSTCIGIYCQVIGQGVFVAHADCARVVRRPGTDFDYVKDSMAGLVGKQLGLYRDAVHKDLHVFTSGTDYACLALQAGLKEWAGDDAVTLHEWDSFRVKGDGSGMTWVRSADTSISNQGPFHFSVPN